MGKDMEADVPHLYRLVSDFDVEISVGTAGKRSAIQTRQIQIPGTRRYESTGFCLNKLLGQS
jgi:hypothetical protein